MRAAALREIEWNLAPPPKLLTANQTVAHGIDFRAFRLDPRGEFDYVTPVLQVVLCCDQMSSRMNGRFTRAYRGMSAVTMPGERIHGEWNGAGTLLGAYLTPAFIEANMERPIERLNIMRGPSTSAVVEYLLQSINADIAQGNPSGPIFIEAAMVSLLHHLSCSPARPSPVRGGLSAWQLNKLMELIDAELASELHLARLAGALGVSAGHLCRGFKASTGRSPHQYILRMRVDRATQLIRAGRRSLEEIAESVGFADGSHMTTVFLKVTGKPPSHFRDQD